MTSRARDCVVAAHTCVCDAAIDVNQNAGNRVLETTLRTIASRLKGILADDFAEKKRAEEAGSDMQAELSQRAAPRNEDAG